MRLQYLLCLLGSFAWAQSSLLFAQERSNPEDAMLRQFEQFEQMIQKLEEHGQKEQADRMRDQLEKSRKAHSESQEQRQRQRGEIGEHNSPAESERRELDQKIHHLRAAAENLHAIGQHDRADELMQQAEQLERELHGQHSPEVHIHREAMEQLEDMRREMHGMREELEGLRAEIRLLRETLLRLPPPVAPLHERRLNPPVIPGPEQRPTPAPPADEHPLQPPGKSRETGTVSLFHSLDRDQDHVVTTEELGPLKHAWESAGVTLPADRGLTAEDFQQKMQAFLNARSQVKISISTTHDGHEPPPVSRDLTVIKAEALFKGLDADDDGQISGAEWNRSRTIGPRFENAHIDLTEPMTKAAFIKHYLSLEGKSEVAKPGK